MRQRGFTLLEIMIALSIFAIMGLASYQLLRGEVLAQQRLQVASDRLNHWQRGMLRLSQDLLQISPRAIREDYGAAEAALVGESDSVTLTRGGWSNPLQRPRSDLQRVHYRVVADEDDGYYLQRSFWPNLDRAPGSEPVSQTLIPGVESISLRYFDGENNEWREQWPPLAAGLSDIRRLPQAIEITLNSAHFGTIRRLVTLSVNRPES